MPRLRKDIDGKYICMKFNQLYTQIWESQGKTANEFVQRIREIIPGSPCTNQFVSRWRHGHMAPTYYLDAICQILEVSKDEFFPQKHSDKYQYSPAYMDEVEQKAEEMAVKNFGIDLTFFKGLRNIIPDFDETFPLNIPLRFYEFDSKRQPFERPEPAAASITSDGIGLFQIERDKKVICLSKYDLKIISHIQKRIREIVSAWFEIYTAAMNKAEMEVNTKYAEVNSDIWETVFLSADDIQAIDKTGIYTEKEARKYKLPDPEWEKINYER